MCEYGNTKVLDVVIPAHRSSTGEDKPKRVDIDSCIFDIVAALNRGGVDTMACCCGHGHLPGDIALADGRRLLVCSEGQLRLAMRAWEGMTIHGPREQE
jgi:hypothetical protein